MTTQPKIIGRFEPIGEEVGPARKAFHVVTKQPAERLGLSGKPGFVGRMAGGPEYSVISEHWQFVPVEQEKV